MNGPTGNGSVGRTGGAVAVSHAVATLPPGQVSPDGFVRLTIPSDESVVRHIQDRILEAVERHGYDDQCHFAIKLALEEALINAIKHGNKKDPAKRVHVEWRVTAAEAEVSVEDEGPGFDRASVPDPTLEENIEKCSGRGILLIEAYMTTVRWSHNGRRMSMVKKNEPAALG